MPMKTIMVLLFMAVLCALGGAGLFMLRKGRAGADRRSKNMARALAVRVGLSVTLFLFILLSWALGWVKPGGIPIGH
jgi:predicted small integral membrane protein